jgi:hypothetical protein
MMVTRPSAMTRYALTAVAGLLALNIVGAQTNKTPADAFLIEGVAADFNGPLTGKVLLVMPISSGHGKPVIRQPRVSSTLGVHSARQSATDKWTHTYEILVDAQHGPQLNPQTTTDAKGAFSLIVPRSLFKDPPGCVSGCSGYKAGELSLGVFDGRVSPFEPEIIKYDVDASIVDAGQLVFKPVHDPAK